MPVTWDIRSPVLLVAAIGDFTTLELTAAIEAAMRDPRFGVGMPILFDARAWLASPSIDEIERRSGRLALMCREGSFPRCAVVTRADPDRAQPGELAVLQLQKLGIDTRAFTDADEAIAWLTGER